MVLKKNDTTKAIGSFLRKKRRDLDISQEQASKEMDIKRATLSHWELGNNSMSLEMLGRLIVGYKTSWHELADYMEKLNIEQPVNKNVEKKTFAEMFYDMEKDND